MTAALTYDERAKNLRQALEKSKPQLQAALPKHITPDRLLRVALTSARRNPKLMECTPASVLASIFACAQLGLVPDDVSGEAYLVPFRNKGRLECQLMPGYKGLMRLAWNAGFVKVPRTEVVYERDEFEVLKGSDARIIHKPHRGRDRGPAVAYYAVIVLLTGGEVFADMEKWEVEEHRDRFSRAKDSGPWRTDFDAMARKTVLRQSLKLVPASSDRDALARAVALDERVEAGVPQEIEIELPPELTEAPATESKDPMEKLADRLEAPDEEPPQEPPVAPEQPFPGPETQDDPTEPPKPETPPPDVYLYNGKEYRAGDKLPDGRLIESVEDGIPVVSKPKPAEPPPPEKPEEDWDGLEKRARAIAGKGGNPPLSKLWEAITETYDQSGWGAVEIRMLGYESAVKKARKGAKK